MITSVLVETQGVTLSRVKVAFSQTLPETCKAFLGDFLGIQFILQSLCHPEKLGPHIFPNFVQSKISEHKIQILLSRFETYPFPEIIAEDCTSPGDRTLVDWIGTIRLLKFSQIHDGMFKEFWFDPYLDKQCRHFTLVSDNNSALIPKWEFIPYLNIFLSNLHYFHLVLHQVVPTHERSDRKIKEQ